MVTDINGSSINNAGIFRPSCAPNTNNPAKITTPKVMTEERLEPEEHTKSKMNPHDVVKVSNDPKFRNKYFIPADYEASYKANNELHIYEAAILDCNEVLKSNPNADAYYNRGFAEYQLKKYDQAIADFKKAIDLFHDQADRDLKSYADAHYYCGLAYDQSGKSGLIIGDHKKSGNYNFQMAVKYLINATDLRPDFSDAFKALGNTYVELHKNRSAITAYDYALKFKPDDSEALINRGLANNLLGERDKALEDFVAASDIKPDYAAYYNIGNIYRHSNKPDEIKFALENYDKAIKINPNYAPAYNNRGIAKIKLNDLDGAIADFKKTFELDPKYAKVEFTLGHLYTKKGEDNVAIPEYLNAIKNDPKKALAYKKLSKAFNKTDQFVFSFLYGLKSFFKG